MKGDIYCTTLGNLLKFDRDSKKFDVSVKISSTLSIQCCAIDDISYDIIYSNHILRYDPDGVTLIEDILLEGSVNNAFYDGDRFVYLATTNGLVIYDNRRNIIEYQSAYEKSLESVTYFDENKVIVSSENKLYIFDNITHEFSPFTSLYYSEYNISSCLVDSNKNLWIGYANNGFHVQYKYDSDFFAKDGVLKIGLSDKNVTAIEHDNLGNIWFVVDHSKLFVYRNGTLEEVDFQKSLGVRLTKQQNLTNIFIDSDDNIYLCINYSILKCRYDGKDFKVVGSKSVFGNAQSLDFGSISVTDYVISTTLMAQADDKSLLIGSVDGSFRYLSNWNDPLSQIFIEHNELTHMGSLIKLHNGKLLGGFYGRDLQVFDPEKHEICYTVPLTEHISNYFYLTSLCEDKDGGIWVGTRTEGVFHVFPDYVTIEKVSGFPCDDICAIVCDAAGNLWVSTYDGLSRYDCKNGEITNYFKENGIGGNQFNYISADILDDGKILFGGNHGLTIINPDEEEQGVESVPFHFDNLFVNNALVVPYMSNIIDKNLAYSPVVRLNHDNRQITVTFSAVDYGNRNHIRYLYSLDTDSPSSWTGVSNGAVSFSKFPYGRHTLYVKDESSENPGINDVIALEIVTRRPVLISIFAISLYVFFSVLQNRFECYY